MDISKAFSPAFLEALRAYIERELNYEYSWQTKGYVRVRDRSKNDLSQAILPYVTVTGVTDFEDYTYYGGYCETCSYEETYCRITYTVEGETKERYYEYSDSFADLIRNLDDVSSE